MEGSPYPYLYHDHHHHLGLIRVRRRKIGVGLAIWAAAHCPLLCYPAPPSSSLSSLQSLETLESTTPNHQTLQKLQFQQLQTAAVLPRSNIIIIIIIVTNIWLLSLEVKIIKHLEDCKLSSCTRDCCVPPSSALSLSSPLFWSIDHDYKQNLLSKKTQRD